MIDIAPTIGVAVGASIPHAALGRDTFDPGIGMWGISAGPAAGFDLGVLLGGIVLPHVSFERAWASCDAGCRATNDVAAFSVRFTSRGTFRVFGDLGIGLRRLTTDPSSIRLWELGQYERSGITEVNSGSDDGNSNIHWTGVDAIRLAVGGAYALRKELAVELKLDCAIGRFDHVQTGNPFLITSLAAKRGFDADIRGEERSPYFIFGLSLAIRGFLPID